MMHLSHNHISSKQRTGGFTLIEMLVAVFVFSVSLAALMTVSAKGLKTGNQSERQVIADYLAIEGVETIRNIRDSVLLSLDTVSTWQDLFDLDDCWSDQQAGIVNACSISYDNSDILLFPCDSCTVFYDDTNYLYRQFQGDVPTGGYTDTGFTREVVLTEAPTNPDELIVTVIVSWDNGRVEYTENLFLWIS